MDDQLLRLLSRIKASPDGPDFIAYLKVLSLDNYRSFKTSSTDMNDVHKGYAMAIDALVESFEKCNHDLEKKSVKQELVNVHY
jgi:hypothetical protein